MRHAEILQLMEFGAIIALNPASEIATIEMTHPAVRHNIAAAQVRGLLRRKLIRLERTDAKGTRYYIYNCECIPGTEAHSQPPREPLRLSGAAQSEQSKKSTVQTLQLNLPGTMPHFGEVAPGKGRKTKSSPQQLKLF